MFDDPEVLMGMIRAHGRFEPIKMVGEGGMGTVVKVRDPRLRAIRAMKVINPDMADHDLVKRRFEAEAALTDKVTHPNIVRVYDIGELTHPDTGIEFLYIVIEWVDGGSLADHIEAFGAMPEQQALAVTIAILNGLGCAHEAGVIHRDIKPDNILLTSGEVSKIADFGIAQGQDATHKTRSGIALGTIGFMPPEQMIDAASVDARADLYAVGMTLWNMLSGKRPPSDNLVWYLNFLSEAWVMEGIDHQLVAVLKRACAEKPAGRYQSCAELVQVLTQALGSFGALSQGTPLLGSMPEMVVEATGLVPGVARMVAAIDAVDDDLPFEPPAGSVRLQPSGGQVDATVRNPATEIAGSPPLLVSSTPPPSVSSQPSVRAATDPHRDLAYAHTHVASADSVPSTGTLAEAAGETIRNGDLDVPGSVTKGRRSAGILAVAALALLGGLASLAVFGIPRLTSESPGHAATQTDPQVTQPTAPVARAVITPQPATPLEEVPKPERPSVASGYGAKVASGKAPEISVGPKEEVPKPASKAKKKARKKRKKRKKAKAAVEAKVRVGLKLPANDPAKVWLVGKAGTSKLPAKVPPGTYKVKAKFKDRPPKVVISSYTVQAGSTPRLKCSSSFARCK